MENPLEKNRLEYCKLGAKAMYTIWKHLCELVEE